VWSEDNKKGPQTMLPDARLYIGDRVHSFNRVEILHVTKTMQVVALGPIGK
jgi:hypothetical protein